MLTLEIGSTFRGKAGANSAITYTLMGDTIAASADTFKTLAQGQLSTSIDILYESFEVSLIREIHIANTTASDVTGVSFYVNGPNPINLINGGFTIPANGSAIYTDRGWSLYNSAGSALQSTAIVLTGDVTGSGYSPLAATLASVNSNIGTYGSNTNIPTYAVDGKGRITASSDAPVLTTPAGQTPVGATRSIGTTAPLSGGGDLSANRTLTISAATTSAAGSQSAIDKKKEDNLWYDVTANSIATLVGDDSTDNTSAWNTFFAALPVGASVYFPPGTYRTSTGFVIGADKHLRVMGAGKYTSIIKTTGLTGNGFHINGSYWYNTFEDMGFQHSGTPTGGAGINIDPGVNGSAVGTNIYRCWFNNLFCGVRAVGQQAANLSVWDSIDVSSNVVNSRGCFWQGEIINMIMSNSTINMGYPPFHVAGTACMEITWSGAIQLVGGEYIGGTNTLLLNGSAGGSSSIAAVYATNCFFDQSAASTVKITGTNITNRCKFVECGITGGNIAGATAVEVASAGTGAAGTATAKADGVDFFDCDIYPNGGSGTIRGFNITGAQGVAINACRISGWTEGIAVTPTVSNGYTKVFITNNKLGATNNFTTPNATGLVLNAGSFQYGTVVVTGNDFSGSTVPLTEAATVAFPWQEYYDGNVGILGRLALPPSTGNQAIASGGTGFITGTTVALPTNGIRVGNVFKWVVPMSKTAAGTQLTFVVRYGTTNVFATDTTAIATGGFTGTAALDSGTLTVTMVVTAIGASATAIANFHFDHQQALTGFVSTAQGAVISGTMAAFNSTLTAPYMNLAITVNTASVVTINAPVMAEILR